MTSNKNIIVIFGGADYEEAEARKVARQAGLSLATATVGGKKVHGGNAYQADGYVLDEGEDHQEVVLFECGANAAQGKTVVAKFDHHNPGDPGFNLGADKFFEASSLGQLMNFLGIPPTEDQKLTAASDHCPADAYAGRCSGITSEAFAAFRMRQKLASYGTDARNAHKNTPETLGAVIEQAKAKLLAATEVDGVRDLRKAGFVDELPEAALSLGLAYMSAIPDTDRDGKQTGNTKIVLGGHTRPETVVAFMEWAKGLPLRVGEPYGNPTRGFAGVIIAPEQV